MCILTKLSIDSMLTCIFAYIQLTEVGTMNIFVHWINENGGVSLYNDVIIMSHNIIYDVLLFLSLASTSCTCVYNMCRSGDSHASLEWYHPARGHEEITAGAGSNMGRLTFLIYKDMVIVQLNHCM